jgi:hypothetical protein
MILLSSKKKVVRSLIYDKVRYNYVVCYIGNLGKTI